MAALEEPLLFSDVLREYVTFLATFAAVGAAGFRWVVMRPVLRQTCLAGTDASTRIAGRALRTAAAIGLLGTLVALGMTLLNAMGTAAEKHSTLAQVLSANRAGGATGLALLALAAVGYLLALGRVNAGWVLAGLGVVGNSLRGIVSGNLLRMLNPFHELMASLWIGTLAVMVVAGITAALRADVPREDRGPVVANMVNAFSPLALFSASLLALSGLWTAWRHLHVLSNLWTTPYGWALMVKLCLVACVAALGAWNWRRVRPGLGGEDAALRLRRSATSELAVAALVLAATAVLVSLPSPRAPGARGGPGEGPPPPGAPGQPPAAPH
jgi:putative copper export protein